MMILINKDTVDTILNLTGARLDFSTTGKFHKNVNIFSLDNSSSVHHDNSKKDISVLGEGPAQGLDDTTITEEGNFARPKKDFCLSLHYNENSSFLFVIGVETHQFKARDSEIKASLVLW